MKLEELKDFYLILVNEEDNLVCQNTSYLSKDCAINENCCISAQYLHTSEEGYDGCPSINYGDFHKWEAYEYFTQAFENVKSPETKITLLYQMLLRTTRQLQELRCQLRSV